MNKITQHRGSGGGGRAQMDRDKYLIPANHNPTSSLNEPGPARAIEQRAKSKEDALCSFTDSSSRGTQHYFWSWPGVPAPVPSAPLARAD